MTEILWYLIRDGARVRSCRAPDRATATERLAPRPLDVVQSAASAAIPFHPRVAMIPERLCARCAQTMNATERDPWMHDACRAAHQRAYAVRMERARVARQSGQVELGL